MAEKSPTLPDEVEAGIVVEDLRCLLPGSEVVPVAGGAAIVGCSQDGRPFEIIFSDELVGEGAAA